MPITCQGLCIQNVSGLVGLAVLAELISAIELDVKLR